MTQLCNMYFIVVFADCFRKEAEPVPGMRENVPDSLLAGDSYPYPHGRKAVQV